ncbi:hypothetical protein EDC04DRAFT_2601892 [Pisolithus marmoratus]|nr:hypothetical protein EDC04DRAFT_2601892 [Pisolithus marmoratus]
MSSNTATRTAKLSKEEAATQDHDEIVELLNKVHLGWGLICVATADDLGFCKMHNNMTAEGLANHMMVQAIQIGIKPSMIAEGLLQQPKTTLYTNNVKWSSHAKDPAAKITQQSLANMLCGLLNFLTLTKWRKRKKRSVALLHPSANTQHPERLDSDTEKLKNVLHLLCEKSDAKVNQVYDTIAKSWIDSKDSNSVQPAFILSNHDLAKRFSQIFTYSTFENSKLLMVSLIYDNLNPYLTGLFLAIFKPMLSILEFLASPYQMPALATACTNILGSRGANDDLSDTDLNACWSISLQDPQYTPMVTVLETFDPDSLLSSWNDVFSEKLLPYMHLFGTSEPEEHQTYQQHFSAYFDKLMSFTQGLITTILPTISDDNVTWPVLTNLVTKLHWVQLGFHPNNEPLIELDTPNTLFTDLSMVVILGNWNTTKISICKGNETGLDINFGPALAEVTDWLFPLCQYPMSGQRGAKHAWTCIMGGVRVFLQNHLDIKDTRKQQMCINQFISLLAGNH